MVTTLRWVRDVFASVPAGFALLGWVISFVPCAIIVYGLILLEDVFDEDSNGSE